MTRSVTEISVQDQNGIPQCEAGKAKGDNKRVTEREGEGEGVGEDNESP